MYGNFNTYICTLVIRDDEDPYSFLKLYSIMF